MSSELTFLSLSSLPSLGYQLLICEMSDLNQEALKRPFQLWSYNLLWISLFITTGFTKLEFNVSKLFKIITFFLTEWVVPYTLPHFFLSKSNHAKQLNQSWKWLEDHGTRRGEISSSGVLLLWQDQTCRCSHLPCSTGNGHNYKETCIAGVKLSF